MSRVAPSEWRWLAAASVIVLGLFSVPYIVGWVNSSPQMQFGGFLVGVADSLSYIAKMRYGAQDGWAFQLMYTSEPHEGGYVYLPLLALGKLVALVSGQGANVSTDTLITGFHVARVVFGALLLGTLYVFIARFLKEPSHRRLAWTIATIGGGLGWLEALTGSPLPGYHLAPVEFYIPEAFTPLLLFNLPHVALARTLHLAGWLSLFRAIDARSWRWALAAGPAWLGMTLCVPIHAGALGIVAVAWLVALWVRQKRIPWRETGFTAAAGLLPALYVGYNLWLFSTNPVFATWSRQNVLTSPPLGEYMLAYGMLILLSVPGVIALVRQGLGGRDLLLIVWPVAGLAMAYLPVNVQRRLLEGIIVPLAILAAMGVVWFVSHEKGSRLWPRLAAAGLVGLLALSSLFFVAGEMLIASQPEPPVYHPADELSGLAWLDANAAPDSIVLSTQDSGKMLPAYAPVRVYVGHGPETVRSGEKTAEAIRFFGDGMDDAQRFRLLSDNNIRYVWIGRAEKALACQAQNCFDAGRLGLVEVFRVGDYSILQVVP